MFDNKLFKTLLAYAERSGIKPAYRAQAASILAHCYDAADLENSIAELRANQPDWFYATKRRAA